MRVRVRANGKSARGMSEPDFQQLSTNMFLFSWTRPVVFHITNHLHLDKQAAAKTEIEAPSEASAARWPLSLFVSQSITTGGLKQAAFSSLDFKHKSKRKKT